MKKTPYIAASITIIFWSSAFPAVKYCLDYYSPEAIMLLRFLVASAVLLGYCAVKRIPPPRKKDLPPFIAAGFVGLFLYMWAFNTGTGMVPSGVSGFIIASAPVFSLIFSIVFLKERAGLLTWLGVIISFIGIAVVASTQVTEMQLNAGVWLLLGAAVCTSVFNVIQKRILTVYTAVQSIAWSVAFASLFMCVFMPKLVRELPSAPITATGVIVYLGIFPAALAYFLWGYALSKAEKTIQVTSFLYLSPFLASVMAFLWLGEEMPILGLLGGVIIIAGMVITSYKRKRSL
jgi:drug/metabolite transporter (DMT)-like permease